MNIDHGCSRQILVPNQDSVWTVEQYGVSRNVSFSWTCKNINKKYSRAFRFPFKVLMVLMPSSSLSIWCSGFMYLMSYSIETKLYLNVYNDMNDLVHLPGVAERTTTSSKCREICAVMVKG